MYMYIYICICIDMYRNPQKLERNPAFHFIMDKFHIFHTTQLLKET